MAISCPTCGTRADARYAVQRSGRLTRCTHCGTAWLARPRGETGRDERALILRPSTEIRGIDEISDAIVVTDIPRAMARPALAPPPAVTRPLPSWGRGAIRFGAMAIATVIAVAVFKAPLVAALPQFSAASAATAGLEFRNVRSETTGAGNARTVMVEGTLVNTLARAIQVPTLRITLKASDGKDVATWMVQPATSRLAAGQSMGFKSARASPPDSATQVTLSLNN